MGKKDLDSSFGSDPEEEEYNWDRFIHEEGGEPAPPEAFWHPQDVPVNNFEEGHILNSEDTKLRLDGSYLARICKVYKCFVCVQIVELTGHKFWTMCDSHSLFPFSETALRRHPDNSKSENAYEKWLTKFMEKNSDKIAPATILNKADPKFYPKDNFFEKGMVLSYMDTHNFTGKLSPAIVTDVKHTGMLKLKLADRSSLADISIMYDDRRLFSIDFTQRAEIPVRCPPKNRKKTPLKPLNISYTKNLHLTAGIKKRGRPKGSKTKIRRCTNKNTSFQSTVTNSELDVADLDISFHPQRASTPLYENMSYNNFIYDTTMQSYNNLTDESSVSGDFVPIEIATVNILSPFKPTLPFRDLQYSLNETIESNRRLFEGRRPVTPSLSTVSCSSVDIPVTSSFSTIDSLLKNTPIMNFQDSWMYPEINTVLRGVSPLASTLHFCYGISLSMAVLNFGKLTGPYIKIDHLAREIPFLPVINYKMQFYNIAILLAESSISPHAVMDIMCPDNLSLPARMTIYVTSNGTTVPKKIPNPNTFECACEWLRYFFRRLRADEELVILHKI